jgi:non-specific serine/threonine protein kinase
LILCDGGEYLLITINIKELRERVPEIIFKQGLDYYKQGRVKITNRDHTSVIASVQGTNLYIVRLTVDARLFESVCTCPHNYICKHAVAVALAVIEDHVRDSELVLDSNWREYFEKQIAIQRVNSEFSQEVRWKLIYVIHVLENYWNLKPIKVYMKKDGTYGRLQEPSYSELSKQNVFNTSSDLIVISYLERLQSQQSNTYYRGRLEASYLNFGLDAGEIFNLLRNSEIHLKNEDGSIGQRIRYGKKSWRLVFRLEENNSHYSFHPYFLRDQEQIRVDRHIKILTTRPIWFYKDGELHTANFPFDYSYVKSFSEEEMKISFSKDEYQLFISDFLAKLPIFPYLEFPEGIAVQELTQVTGKRIYLEEMDEQLVVSLSILYNNVEVSFNQNNEQFLHYDKKTNHIIRIRRRREVEEKIRDEVVASNIIEDTPGLFYANYEAALDWLFDGLPKLVQTGFEVMGEESLVRFKVRRRQPTISTSFSSETDWFDLHLEIDFDGISLTLAELKKALQKQKRYVRLRDGSIARLPERLIQKFQYLIEFGQTNEKSIRLRDHHLSFVDRLLTESEHKQYDEISQMKLKKLDGFSKIKNYNLPKNLKGELRDYQRAGFNWLNFLKEFSFGGVLADDMGLGKTVQTLALVQNEINKNKIPVLIVAPTSVLFNWQREIEKFTPGIDYILHYGTKRTRDVRRLRKKPLILTTYGHLRRDISFLSEIDFHYVVLDESQNIKNPQSDTAQAARNLLAKNRLALTGTPIENNTMELWSQFSFLSPGLLGNQNFFKDNFMRPIEKEQNNDVATTLKRLIFPFILRRTKEEVVKELPPKVENVIFSPMSEAQQKIYDQIRDTFRNTIISEIQSKGLDKTKMRILEGLTKLRQVSCHPLLVDATFQDESGKFEALKLMIDEIISENHKVLVFSQFVRMLTIVREYLEEQAIDYAYLDGSTRDRAAVVDKFQDEKDVRIFLISLKAGGFGLNLTAADYVIHYDPWWNPAVEMQASDRAHRIGQTKKVFTYKLIAKDSVEEKILALQQHKKELVKQIITTEGGFFKSLTKNDILNLFT